MLRSIRNNSKGTIAKIIIAAILIIFALGGLSTCENKAVSPLKVNGETVDQNELILEMQIVRNQLLSNMGENVDYEQLSQEKILPLAINRLTEQLLIEQSLDDMLMTIPDSMVENIIFNNPSFQDKGVFSNQLLTNFINNQGITIPLLKRRIANDLNQSQLTSGIALSHFSMPFNEKIFLDIFNERRKISLLNLSLDDFYKDSDASLDELEIFYKKNKLDFKSDLQVIVEFIEFKLEDLFKPVSNDEVISEYNIQLSQFAPEESREISHILLEINDDQNEVQVLEKFKLIKQRLDKGELFADLALEFSQDLGSSGQGGYLGFIEEDSGFPDSFEKAVFSMNVGDISEPVKTEAGLHMISLTSKEKSSLGSLDTLRDEIEEQIKIRKARLDYINLLEEAADISFNAADLTEPAEVLEMEISVSPPINRTVLSGQSTDDLNEIFKIEKVRSAIFTDEILAEGLNSEIIELGEDHSILLRAKDVIQPRQLSLNEVKDEILLTLKTTKAKNKLDETSKGIFEKVSSGASFEKAVIASNYELKELTLSRGSVDIDPQLLDNIFEKHRSLSLSKVNEYQSPDGDIYLYIITDIFKDDGIEPESIVALGQQIQSIGGQQDISNFMNSIRLKSDIEVQ